jgi:hypothetical protein
MTNSLMPVILGLTISGIWLASKFNVVSYFSKVNDSKGIVIPSIFFLTSPFLFTYIFSIKIEHQTNEIFKSSLPIITFIFGQFIAKCEKQKEEYKKHKQSANILMFILEQIVLEYLFRIENELIFIKKTENLNLDDIKKYSGKFKIALDNDYPNLRNQPDFFHIDTVSGSGSLPYIGRVKEKLEYIYSVDKNTFDLIGTLIDVRSLKIQGYLIIIILLKEVIKNDSMFKLCILKLKQERERLVRLKNIQAKKLNYCSNPNRAINQYGQMQEVDWHLLDSDMEEFESIKQIEDIFKDFKITD